MHPKVKSYLRKIGAKGGAAGRGSSKRRTSKQASEAAKARWLRMTVELPTP